MQSLASKCLKFKQNNHIKDFMIKNSYLKQNTQMYPTHVNIRIAVITQRAASCTPV